MKIYREKIGEINDRLNAIEAREKEISERAKAIKDELESCQDDAVINERKTETEKLTAERASLETEKTGLESEKDELIKKNDEETKRNAMTGVKFKGENNMNLAERREAFFKALREKTLTFEARGILSSDTPFVTGADGVTGIKDVAPSLVDYVEISEKPGQANERVQYDKDNGAAFAAHAPGAAIAASNPATGIVELPSYEMAVLIEVDNGALENPNVDIEDFVHRKMLQAWRKKLSTLIANGDTTKFYGIGNAVDADSASMVEAVTLTAIDEDALTALIMGATGSADEIPGDPILVLTKAQLKEFSKVRGSDKKKVYTFQRDPQNVNTGIISDGGMSARYILCSTLPANTMLFGKGLGYRLNLYSDLKVDSSADVDFKSNMTAFRGVARVGGNVTEYKSWAKVTVTPGK